MKTFLFVKEDLETKCFSSMTNEQMFFIHFHNGEGGIRTHGTLTSTTVFETARFNHSRTSPILQLSAFTPFNLHPSSLIPHPSSLILHLFPATLFEKRLHQLP